MRQIFRFLAGFNNLGIGTSNLGLVRSQSEPINSMYGPGRNVQRSFGPTAPGFMKWGQELYPVSLMGGGTELSGTVDLQTLSEMAKASSPNA